MKDILEQMEVDVIDNNLSDKRDLGRVLDYICQDVYNQFLPDLEKGLLKRILEQKKGWNVLLLKG